jgi:acyl-CoA thioesterase
MGAFEFDAATALSASGPVFGVDLDGRWDGQGGTNGGFLLALAARAIGTSLPFPDPLVVSGFYVRPGTPGAAEIRTEVVRAGRSTGFGQASLLRDGKEVLRTTAAFTDLAAAAARGAPSYAAGRAPDQPPPERCQVLEAAMAVPISLVGRLEYRSAELPYWLAGRAPSGHPQYQGWIRFADGREPDPLALLLFVDAVAPAVLELGLQRVSTIQLTVDVRARPAPGWVAFRTLTRFMGGGYLEEDAELWDSAGRLVAQSRQLALVVR